MSSTSDRIDSIAIMCLDTGLALCTLFIPADSLRELVATSFSYSSWSASQSCAPSGSFLWRTVAGPVNLLAQSLDSPERLHIDSKGMVDCSLNSAPTLILLNKLLRLKVYDPSPV